MIKEIKSIIQFARGSSLVWSELTTPIPDGAVSFSIDDGVFKLGDGVTLYNALPVLFTYDELVSAQGGLSKHFITPTIEQNGNIVIVSFDPVTNTIKYSVSDTTLVDLLSRIDQLELDNTNQDASIAELLSYALSIDASINTASNNNVIIVNNKRYVNSNMSLTEIQYQVAAQANYVPGSHLCEIELYIDSDKTSVVDKFKIFDGNTYFCDIVGFNNDAESVSYALTATNPNVVINNVTGSLFSVYFNNVTSSVRDDTPVILIASVNSNTGNSLVKKAISCLVQRQRIIVGIYGGDNIESYSDICEDYEGNIITIGMTLSEGSGVNECLVMKFDSELNIITKKLIGGANVDSFQRMAIDRNNNIFIVGYTTSEGVGTPTNNNAIIYKLDQNCNIITRKVFEGSDADLFMSVCVDPAGNVYVCGHEKTQPITTNWYSGMIVKFNNSLSTILAKKYCGVANTNTIYYDIGIDNNGYIYACGIGASPSVANYNAVITRFDSSLNIVANKLYYGPAAELFYALSIDSDNNIYCVGHTLSEGPTVNNYSSALIVKFDSSLNIITKKLYAGNNTDTFYRIKIKDDNLFVVGWTQSAGNSAFENGLFVKFDSSLNILDNKLVNGAGLDRFISTCPAKNSILLCGVTATIGPANNNALIIKLPKDIPDGTFSNSDMQGFTIEDFTGLSLIDSALTLEAITFTINDLTSLTLNDSTMNVNSSNLTYTKAYFN